MAGKRFGFLVAVHGFLRRGDKVLLLKRANTGYMDGKWSVPAGHVDGGEKVTEAMRQELVEEVGVEVGGVGRPVHVMHRIKKGEKEERIDFFFEFRSWRGEVVNVEPEKCGALEWFEIGELPDEIVEYVAYALEKVVEGEVYSEFDEE